MNKLDEMLSLVILSLRWRAPNGLIASWQSSMKISRKGRSGASFKNISQIRLCLESQLFKRIRG